MSVVGSLGVLIVTYRRPVELRRCLTSITTEPADSVEVLIVDNDDARDTAALVLKILPRATYLALPGNPGPIRARNLGLAKMNCDWVLCLDDDAAVLPGTLRTATDLIGAYPDALAIAGAVLDPYHPAPATQSARRVLAFPEGACLIRRRAFWEVGGYAEQGYREGEGRELALRGVAHGLAVWRDPRLVVEHSAAKVAERRDQIAFQGARHDMMTTLRLVPWPLLPAWITVQVLSALRVARRHHTVPPTLSGLWGGCLRGCRDRKATHQVPTARLVRALVQLVSQEYRFRRCPTHRSGHPKGFQV